MTAKTHALPPRRDLDRDPHLPWIAERSGERALLIGASVFAAVLHLLAFLIDVPVPSVVLPPPQAPGPIVYKTKIPPPKPPPTDIAVWTAPDTPRKVPVVLQEPEDPGPVREPAPEVIDSGLVDAAFELDVADPVAPPAPTGPRIITPDISSPVLIQDSKVNPAYPELPRRAQMAGSVILQAVIRRDGSVGEVTVLRCNPPGLGFEEAAVDAVAQWRYEPARQMGNPVEVYFTVHVSFELH